MRQQIPLPVQRVIETLRRNGYEAWVVGGCVRDLLLERVPKDWDVTTSATPPQILQVFPDSFYENTFGTVGVKVPRFLDTTPSDHENDIIEVTTYRAESGYTDSRRPDTVTFVSTLHEDLARRDFTINAIAYGPTQTDAWEWVDPFHGEEDLKKKIIRTVGNPQERLEEDTLRLMRAVRFFAELRDPTEMRPTHQWRIEPTTFAAIQKLAKCLTTVSQERIRDELSRIILSQSPGEGISLLEEAGLLTFIIPELREGIGIGQNLHHIYTVWEHNIRALATCPSKKLEVRLAALLHDVGKPRTKRGDGYHSTFYNHDHVGGRMTRSILTRLRYPKSIVDKASLLVDQHLFYYNVGEVTEASVRRLIRRVGLENMADLMDVRIGDRLGSGVPKAKPYKLRHLEYMIEKVSRDPLSVKMLAITGTDLMTKLAIPAGPKIGAILDVLLAAVIEDPTLNTKVGLLHRAETLMHSNLTTLRAQSAEKIEKKKEAENQQIKKRHWVQ